MKNCIKYFAFIGLLYSSGKLHAFMIPDEYKDGIETCKEHAETINSEFGKWISVPAYYDQPNGPTTSIYYYTKKKFDPTKKSVLYFVGGPGGVARRNEFSLPNTNVIFFDQRGVACSLPPTKEMYLDPKFYSSENTAKDAAMVLNSIGIKKASIFGHSYGTVPATIFASKYPKRTSSLILEGVVFKADETLWISKRKIKLMEEFFYSFPKDKQEKLISVTERNDMPKTWFSYMARMGMGTGNFKNGIKGFLDETVFKATDDQEASDAEFAQMMTSMIPTVDLTTPAETYSNGDVMMGMIACQEMSMANPEFSHLLILKDGHFIPDRNNTDRKSMCAPLHLENNTNEPYTAEKYPVNVPVTYFLGEYDPATSLDQGLRHFKFSKSKQKQALIMPEGGHTPSLEMVIESGYCSNSKDVDCDRYKQQIIQASIFEKAVNAEIITPQDLQNFNQAGEKKWEISN